MTADGAAEAYKASLDDPAGFWASEADRYHWQTPFDESNVYSANFKKGAGPIAARWFEDGATNIAYNCLDRQVGQASVTSSASSRREMMKGRRRRYNRRARTYAEALERRRTRGGAAGPGRQEGRPRRVIYADGPRARHRHARVRAHRRRAHGGLRRLLARLARVAHRQRWFACGVLSLFCPSPRHGRRSAARPAGATCVIAADGVRRGGKVIDLWGIAKDALASVFARGVLFALLLRGRRAAV